MSMSIAKKGLRKHIKQGLKNISQESLSLQSRYIHDKLIQHEKFQNAKSIALYMNMPDSEVRTMEMIKTSFQLGKSVYLPRCNYTEKEGRKKNFLSMLNVNSFQDVQNLRPQGKYKLLEPVDGEDAMESGSLDIIIVPGVAFTKTKKRMGHGAGFYDEFLNYYYKKHNRKPYLIGVALEEQLIEDLPTEEHDWNLDSLIVANHDIIY
ncbi:5,10-methenyltetrahydrofolate synthetase [Spathaspora passalidarum NRRL Y-27907]|uniref:5-formyltetrahydrofolate cyclo-ligase n=1 Tax=Spathaspora passalidarum (strain NRRL Y-27907 / 11-Y1) TaxID=619300 RepID=G3AF13_SPAPN|nr:5,10-methenyltetrahydrofolate synthetase [Spathaspora passalidarum NRRL Y-27907]EGW34817.1 5,10-methenyltetrahydrofolate synthetase [Spathaspora passalidarum NRRL Y-27907]